MSSAFCPVVRINKFGLNKNSTNLMVWNGPHGPVQFQAGSIQEGGLAMYVPPGHIVDTTIQEFRFLAPNAGADGRYTVKPIKLRGVPSVGLLIPLRNWFTDSNGVSHMATEGRDLASLFWIEKEQSLTLPTNATTSNESPTSPPKYDIEGYPKARKEMPPEGLGLNIEWSFTEKIHGANMRFMLGKDEKVVIGSRNRWINKDGGSFAQAYRRNQLMVDTLAINHPGVVFYGQCYGKVQDLTYGLDHADIVMFDAYDSETMRYWSASQLMTCLVALGYGHKYVPVVNSLCCTFDEAVTTAKSDIQMHNGKSLLYPDGIMEGIVIRPRNIGRPIAKVINPDYITRKGGTEYS